MALNNWVGIITAVQEFTGRSDLTTAKVDYFIDLAEAYFNNNLRTHEMETTNGSLTYSSGAINNPSDFLGWKRLSITSNGKTTLLQPVSYEQNEMIDDGTTDMPSRYVIRGTQTLLRPTPDSSSYTISGTYYQRIPALSDTASTNWISTNYADAYFFPVMAMAEAYVQNDMRLQTWVPLLEQAVSGIQKTDSRKNWGQMGSMTTEYPVY